MTDRLSNATGEAALLGALMIDNGLIVDMAGRLRVDDFSEAVHGRIFGAMMRFAAKGMAANAITLRPVFQNDSDAKYGDYLAELVDNPAAVVGARAFADQVIDLAARRAARDAMHRGMESLVNDLDRPIAEIVGGVEEAAWAAEERAELAEVSDIGDMLGAVEERDDRIVNDPGAVGITNAFVSDMDKALGPLEGGTYLLIAGRPGMGKSVLASSSALGYAANGHAGSYFHLEMSREQQAMRVASDLSFAMGRGIDHAAIKKGALPEADRQWLRRVRERGSLLPIRFVAMKSGTDIQRIWSMAARHKAMWAARGQKLTFVVIDYLGLCSATDAQGEPIENDRARMNKISSVVRRMADDLDIAVIAVAQLSRAVEARQNKRPIVSDLKETGNLEQDADAVLLLYREEAYLEEQEPKRGEVGPNKQDLHEAWEVDMNAVRGKVDLIVGKNRHAAKRTRTAKFVGKHFAIRGGEVDEYGEENLLL